MAISARVSWSGASCTWLTAGRLLAPRDRNKTLAALAGAGPLTGAQHPAVQRALVSR